MSEGETAYRLLLCHRRRSGVTRGALAAHWRGERARLLAELRDAIGFTRYTQVHPFPRYHPIYRVLLWSRSPAGEVMFFPTHLRRALRAYRNRPRGAAERWDAVDQLWFPSADALERAFTTEAGREAARRLRDDQESHADHTRIVLGEERVASQDDSPEQSGAKVLYLLRCPADMSPEEMRAYWGREHRELVMAERRGMGFRGFEQVHADRGDVLDGLAGTLGAEAAKDVHGVASLSFAGQLAMAGSLLSPTRVLSNRRVLADELRFLDSPRCCMVFGKEHVVETAGGGF